MHAPNDSVTPSRSFRRDIWSRHGTTATPLLLPACALALVSGWSSSAPWAAPLLVVAAVLFSAIFYVLRICTGAGGRVKPGE
jgi:hypothetical protein